MSVYQRVLPPSFGPGCKNVYDGFIDTDHAIMERQHSESIETIEATKIENQPFKMEMSCK